MSRIAKLYPTRIYRTRYDPVIENESNMYTGIDSDTYASVTNNSIYSGTLFLGGFNFSLVPSNAIISSFSIKMLLGREDDQSSISRSKSWLYNGTNAVTLTNNSSVYLYSPLIVSVLDPTPLSFEDLRTYGDNLNLLVHNLANSTTRVYGVEIDVEYDLPKNKVVYFGQTLIDLTADTVTAERLTKGFTAHDASGALITGIATEGSTYQDEDGCVVLGEDESSAPQGNISITQNGTYDVADYAGADVNIPVGMTETELKAYIERSGSFTSIEWPDGLTKIGPYAFAYCKLFNPSSLPEGITIISRYAFYGCDLFNPASFPSTLETIETNAFAGCGRWTRMTELPSGVTSIGSSAFSNCSLLPLTSLPSGITAIAGSTFLGCSKLALTSLPSGVTTISSNCFNGCSMLALTSLPSGITAIPDSAFVGCTSLALTSLPSGVTSISSNAFRSCTSLTSISCDGAITTLGSAAFNGNTNLQMQLTSVSFPNMALTSNISPVFGSTTAVYACQQLEFCDIGSTIGIGASAFANCYALETLVLRKTTSVCTLGNVSAFLNTPMRGYNGLTGTVYVPSALISAYQTATNWSTLYNDGTVEFLAIEGSEYERD